MKFQNTKLISRNVASLYTNNELSEGAKNPIYNFIKKNKIPRNDSNQKVKDLHSENFKTQMREIEEYTPKNGKIFNIHGLEESILLKYLYAPKQSII